MLSLRISDHVEEMEETVEGVEFEVDGTDDDKFVSIVVGNQMVAVDKASLKRIVNAL